MKRIVKIMKKERLFCIFLGNKVIVYLFRIGQKVSHEIKLYKKLLNGQQCHNKILGKTEVLTFIILAH